MSTKPHPAAPDRWILRLYIARHTQKSSLALANLKRICQEHLAGRYEIEVIDLHIHPNLAVGHQIIAIPTLVRVIPHPLKKIIGDLTNELRVLVGLDLSPRAEPPTSSPLTMKPNSDQATPPAPEIETEAETDDKPYVLRLYIAGMTPRSTLAVQNLRKICEEHLQGRYTLEVIDIYQQPLLAEGDQVMAVPTLIRKLPEPIRRFVGDMSDTQRLLVGLDLRAANTQPVNPDKTHASPSTTPRTAVSPPP
jgi:circadian clock protein KaiB